MTLFDDASNTSGNELPRLGVAQRDRLKELSHRAKETVFWDGISALHQPDALVVVREPANAARLEALIRSLDGRSIVALLFSESPVFDAMKSRLVAHGMIGAEAARSPHQLWWGGVEPLRPQTGVYRRDEALFISCYVKGLIPEATVARLGDRLDLLGLDRVVAPLEMNPAPLATRRSRDKIGFIRSQLSESARPVMWIDPQATVRQHPLLPQSLGCDVAFLRRPQGEVDTRVLFFRPTAAAHALLEVWYRLSTAYPGLPECFLFDQAWTLTCAQRPLETAWLPLTYAESDPVIRGAVIELDASPRHLLEACEAYPRVPRRFGRACAPEPHLILQGDECRHRPIVVVIRDLQCASAGEVGAAVESIASAFEADCGGFPQMESVLCGSDDDIAAVMQLDFDSWVVIVDAHERFAPDSFARLGRAATALDLTQSSADATADEETAPALGFAPASMQALLRSGTMRRGTLLRRPASA